MPPDVDLIRLCVLLHDGVDPAPRGSTPLPAWTALVQSWLGPVGHVRAGDVDVLIWPGTKELIDIWIDGDAVPIEMARLWKVHAGFMAKPLDLKGRLDVLLGSTSQLIIAGHSKGAAEALNYGALRIIEGKPVRAIVTFGCPMPGCQPMKDLLAPVPIRNYRNQVALTSTVSDDIDPVTTVPFPVPIEFPCLEMRGFTPIVGAPAPGDTGRFRLHHGPQYYAGMRALHT